MVDDDDEIDGDDNIFRMSLNIILSSISSCGSILTKSDDENVFLLLLVSSSMGRNTSDGRAKGEFLLFPIPSSMLELLIDRAIWPMDRVKRFDFARGGIFLEENDCDRSFLFTLGGLTGCLCKLDVL